MTTARRRQANAVMYAKAFFDLQLQFAHTVTALSGWPLARTLLEYTNLYVRFGLGRDFDPAHPTWREYLAGLQDTNESQEWTYRFHVARSDALTAPPTVATFGCFSFARLNGDRIRLHFQNAETDGHSPLGIERLDQRLADLAALFGHIKRTLRQPLQVVGASWLYNLDAYRRLFPLSYLATAHVIHHRFQHMPLWGQFLDRDGELRQRERLDVLADAVGLEVLDGEDVDGARPVGHGLPGVIKALLFVGDRYEARVALGGEQRILLLLPRASEWREGQRLRLGFPPETVSVWPV